MNDLEQALVAELDRHDALVLRAAAGDLSWSAFVIEYDSFYPRFPLDGHEAWPGPVLIEKYEARIALHRAIWEDILTRVISDRFASDADGENRITEAEALRRLRALVAPGSE